MNLITDNVFFVGDIHGAVTVVTDLARAIPENSIIIQVGDFGLGFRTDDVENRFLKHFNDKTLQPRNIHLIAIRGNHDNPARFGAHASHSNLHLLQDYSVCTINGHRTVFIGGGISIDRSARWEGRDYWKDEGFVFDESKLAAIGNAEILVTHSAPESFNPVGFNEFVCGWIREDRKLDLYENDLEAELLKERKKLQVVHSVLDPKVHVYGHFHRSVSERTGKGCLARLLDINEVWDATQYFKPAGI